MNAIPKTSYVLILFDYALVISRFTSKTSVV